MISDRFQELFREVLHNDNLDISKTTSKSDVPSWDSLVAVKLISGLDEEYGVKFSTREIAHPQTFGDFLAALSGHDFTA